MAENQQYYNFTNLDDYLRMKGITYPEAWLRWVKDIINTKETMFYYENLPDGLTSQIIEQSLMFNNFLCFYKSNEFGLVLCRYKFGGEYDLYWKPKTVDLLTISGQPLKYGVPYSDIVLARDNIMDIIPFLTLNGYIEKIIDKEKTLDALMVLIRFPKILTGEKEQVSEFKRLIKKAINCDPIAVGAKGFAKTMENFDITIPVKPIEVYELMEKYKNLALASMGIYGVDEKRERIVTSEVQANNDYVDFVYTGMFREREQFVELLNKKFGTNIILHETYVENQIDDIDVARKKAMALADANVKIEKTKNDGKVEASKVEGLEAAKIKPSTGGGDA